MLYTENKTELFCNNPAILTIFSFHIDIIILLVYYNYSNGTVLAVLLKDFIYLKIALYCSTGRLFFCNDYVSRSKNKYKNYH